MIVVADTTPLNYLVLIGQVHVLQQILGSIVVPPAVVREMLHPSAPVPVRAWANNLPVWVEIRDPGLKVISFSQRLGNGEREAIALAQTYSARLILIDENRGRKLARHLGFKVTGTLGILQEAHRLGFLSIDEAVSLLQTTNFQISPRILQSILAVS